MVILAVLAAVLFYGYSIRNTIRVAPKAGCGSCPHKLSEDEKMKLD